MEQYPVRKHGLLYRTSPEEAAKNSFRLQRNYFGPLACATFLELSLLTPVNTRHAEPPKVHSPRDEVSDHLILAC